jgi:hypothetical protein
MSDTLKESLVNYYDFAVAYENLLRDSAAYKSLSLESLSGGVSLSNEQKLASIYYFAKQKENRTIIHFINFLSSKTLLWADPKGIQTKPQTVKNIKIKIPDPGKIKNVWIASPDTLLTMPLSVPFVKGEGFLEVSLPYLKYWDMLVIEHDSSLSSIENPKDNLIKENFYLGQNYPNPFNPRTTIPFATGGGDVVLRVFNVLGQEVYENILNAPSGQASVEFDGQMHSAGTYFYSLQHEDQIMTKKMNLLK